MTETVDIAIVGAGMVGATLALSLAKNTSYSIALIESKVAKKLTAASPPALRVSAINIASQQFLADLDIWQQLITERLGPFDAMQVWEDERSTLFFDAAEIGVQTLGHIVENQHIQDAALQLIESHPQIRLMCPAELTALQQGQLKFMDQSALSAKLIIAADGSHSKLRAWADIQTRGWQYAQQGLVCVIETEFTHQRTARQIFLPDGPLALLPLAHPHQCSVVWSVSDEQATTLLEMNKLAFNEKLAMAFQYQAGSVSVISERASFPLALQHAKQYVKPGFVLVGDAAHQVHPLAGQGVNMGFQDAIALTELLQHACLQQRDISSLQFLKKYQRRRLADNLLMQFTLDGVHQLFNANFTPLVWTRRHAMHQLNRLEPLKRWLMQQAAGS